MQKNMSKQFDIERAFYYEATPQKVFEALTDSKVLVKWWPMKAAVDPRDGGDFSLGFKSGYVLKGKLKHFEKNKSVSYSWLGDTTASFEVTTEGDGTLLKFRHVGFEDPEDLAPTASAWAYYLTNMKSVLDHGTDLRSNYDDIFDSRNHTRYFVKTKEE